MESQTDSLQKDSDDIRLRRFTMSIGIVFVLITCGEARFEKEGEVNLPIFGNKIILESPEIIYWLVFLSSLYALGLFCYRNLYKKTPPCVMRGWLKQFGVMVEYLPKASEDFSKRDNERDLIFAKLAMNSKMPEGFRKISQNVPTPYLNEFMITLDTSYADHSATLNQVIVRILERYFPSLRNNNLTIVRGTKEYCEVKIENLDTKTRCFIGLENFVYFLPLIPFGLAYSCLIYSLFQG